MSTKISTTLTIVKTQSYIADQYLAGLPPALLVKLDADEVLNRYIPQIHPYITRIESAYIREIFAAEGTIGYLIRVYVTCPLEIVKQFHKEAGVEVDVEVKA